MRRDHEINQAAQGVATPARAPSSRLPQMMVKWD
jgi:hypothetical protein